MKNAGQLFLGLISAIGSTLLVLSAASLALLEGGAGSIALVTVPATQAPLSITASPQPILMVTATQPVSPTATATETRSCQNTPADWLPYTVQPGDTILSLVVQSGVSTDEFLKANCFKSASLRLEPGWVVYVPATVPTATVTVTLTPAPELPTPIPCGAPNGWVNYIVQPGDTLFRLSLALGISQYELQSANCLTGTQIYAGQTLRVPFIPARPPTATRTPTRTTTPVPPTPVTPVVKQDQTITFGALADKTFGDAAFPVSATATSGLAVTFSATGNCSMAGNTVTLTGAGSCTVTASQAGDSSYNPAPDVSQSFSIQKATATVTLGALAHTYDGSPRAATVTTTPAGLPVTITYDGNSTPPINAGSYAVSATVNDANYQGSATGTLTISKANAAVALSGLTYTYDGIPHAATATTTPAGLNVTITYNGSSTPPTDAGSYAVVATVNDVNYQGSATGTLQINEPPSPAG